MLRTVLIPLSLIAIITSCKKDNEDDAVESQTSNSLEYLPLDEGNYWVYEHRRIDSNGVDEPFGSELDTVRVTRDTVINGQAYKILEGRYAPWHNKPNQIVDIVRDSAGYLVSYTGRVLISVKKFDQVFANDTVYTHDDHWFYASAKKIRMSQNELQVPAGKFVTIFNEDLVLFNPDVSVPFYERVQETHYAKGVGRVMQRYFYAASPYTFEKRLVDYNIQ